MCQAQCCAIVKKNALEVQSFSRARCQVELGDRDREARGADAPGTRACSRACAWRAQVSVIAERATFAPAGALPPRRAAACAHRRRRRGSRRGTHHRAGAIVRRLEQRRALYVRARAENRRRDRPSGNHAAERMSARSGSARARCTPPGERARPDRPAARRARDRASARPRRARRARMRASRRARVRRPRP